MATDGSIEPDSFDLIVVGTGLQEAILAAAAAASRRLTVLHLDPHEFYGAHWTSLDFKQFSSWATSGGRFSVPSQTFPAPAESATSVGKDPAGHDSGGIAAADFSGATDSGSGQGLDYPVGEESVEKNDTASATSVGEDPAGHDSGGIAATDLSGAIDSGSGQGLDYPVGEESVEKNDTSSATSVGEDPAGHDSGGIAATDLSGAVSSGSGQGLDCPVGEESVEKNDTSSAEEELHSEGRGEAPIVADQGEFEEMELESGKQGLFSGLEVLQHEGASLGPSRSYSIDLCGPRLTLCGSNLVNMLLRSGASNYVEFKGVDASYIWTGAAGGMSAVPSSRADVFKDRALSLPDKRFLMRFFKLVTDYANASSEEQQLSVDISAEDLDAPFLDFMQRQRLPTSIQSIIFYAIALVDEDQQCDVEDSSVLLRTRDGLQKLALYLSSVARFPNASGAFLYPLYGQGEIPQAFCRSAAVNGTLYVLRRPVKSLLLDKDSKEYRGVRTLQGQVLFSKKLILGPSVLLTPGAGADHSFARLDDQSMESSHSISSASAATAVPGERVGSQVARCVCITDHSLFEGQSTLLVIFPPRSVHEKGSNTIRALQLSSAASVCPEDKYIVQLSTICSDETDGRIALEAAVQALFASPHYREAKNVQADSVLDVSNKPNLLWSIFYIQALQTNVKDWNIPGVAFCKMPDGTLDGENLLTETEKLFREMFPDEDFFPQAVTPKDPGEDDDLEES